MGTVSLSDEDELDLVISYPVDDETSASDAVVDAFLAADVDVFQRRTMLEDWISTDALDQFTRKTDNPSIYVSAWIWDHRVVLTRDEVCIYVDTPPQSDDGRDTLSPDP